LSLSTIKDCLSNEQACRKEMGANIDQTLDTEGRGRSKS